MKRGLVIRLVLLVLGGWLLLEVHEALMHVFEKLQSVLP